MQSWNGFDRDLPAALWIPTLLLTASAVFVFSRQLGPQILARAAWWSNLILGTLIAFTSSSSEVISATALAATCGAALLLAGRSGLSGDSGAFRPVAFRATLLIAMIMALADTQSLLLFGTLEASEHSGLDLESGLMLGSAAFMVVAMVGLFRLRVWGLALNIVANVVIAILAATDCYDLPDPLVYALVTTAVLQLLLPIPMIAAIARRASPSAASV